MQSLNMREFARMANMSIAQFERYFHKFFHLTLRQVLLKTQLDAATALLVTHDKVTDVAALCGYTDHNAFTRQFKATVGIHADRIPCLVAGSAAGDRASRLCAGINRLTGKRGKDVPKLHARADRACENVACLPVKSLFKGLETAQDSPRPAFCSIE